MSGGKGKISPKDGKPFVKGDPRINRKGRPPKLPDLDSLLAEVLADEREGISAMKLILIALRKRAFAGDVRAGELLLDRAYGKLKQSKELDLNLDSFSEETLTVIANNIINATKK
jgi:hypothetical protein